jgi:hypothetical protein
MDPVEQGRLLDGHFPLAKCSGKGRARSAPLQLPPSKAANIDRDVCDVTRAAA